MAQKDPIGVVFDFDGTLTPKHYGSLITVVEKCCLPEGEAEKAERIKKLYFRKAALGPVAPSIERRLIRTALQSYAECGLRREQWQRSLNEVKLREGVADKIRELTGRGIRVGVISFSVADFIERVLELNGLGGAVHRVYAARLIHDKRNKTVVGWNSRTLVHPFDKGIWSMVFAKHYGIAPERLLAVGDSIGDYMLGLRQELRLGIAKDKEEANTVAPYMGEVITTEDFSQVGDWIDKKIRLILSG
ncbi:haloacid dehalogenase-like hydrolase [Candidatus Uhrbacteria bacterium]|nr:haloacid dehalogenase-like hydrolase [Candidatus Uhrbacteria bacterium]